MRTQNVELTIRAVFRDDELTGSSLAAMLNDSDSAHSAASALFSELASIEAYGGEICGIQYYAEGQDDI